jgi:DNA invertase Pin-like site-specific DNA recombinase
MADTNNAKIAVCFRVRSDTQLITVNKKTALYCRSAISDDSAVMRQEQRLRQYSNENGYENPVCYTDNGASGSNFNRTAFNRLMSDIESGDVNCVITSDFARLSRSVIQLNGWLKQMDDMGVSVISVADMYDSFNPPGRLSELRAAIKQIYKS